MVYRENKFPEISSKNIVDYTSLIRKLYANFVLPLSRFDRLRIFSTDFITVNDQPFQALPTRSSLIKYITAAIVGFVFSVRCIPVIKYAARHTAHFTDE